MKTLITYNMSETVARNFLSFSLKSKIDKSITAVQEVLMNLRPGLQYLENNYRKFVITGAFRKQKAKKISCGHGFTKFDAWSAFCTEFDSSIRNNWIRVALVSRKISPKIHEFVSKE